MNTTEPDTNKSAPDEDNQEEELQLENVENPGENDVLCGRGGAALRHPGNQTYRRLVQLNKGLYITCIKAEKLKISRSIVAAIREQKGRFLEKNNKTGKWDDIGDKKALEKTSQALREGQPKLRQQMAEMSGGAVMMETQYAPASAVPQVYSSTDPSSLVAATAAYAASGEYNEVANAETIRQMNLNMNNVQNTANGNMQQTTTEMPPPLPSTMGDILQRLSLSDIQEEQQRNGGSIPSRMRPSIVQRGSAVAQELGLDNQSNLSLMSDFSNYGMSPEPSTPVDSTAAGTDVSQQQQQQQQAASSPPRPASTEQASTTPPTKSSIDADRRKLFARMKYSRAASGRMNASGRMSNNTSMKQESMASLGDGMPDIHFVESNISLFSNLSSVGDPGEWKGEQAPPFESRRSLMSGLSRISDSSEVNSLFSDLSKKIGNVSTRSMAMSEISNMDDIDALDEEVMPRPLPPSGAMAPNSMEYE